MESPVSLAIPFDVQALSWILAAVQVVGLLSTWLARSSVGCRGQRPCQWLFLSCLTLVGLGTVAAMAISAAHWLFSAGTLALMILAAVWDFGGQSSTEVA
jgi:hypothetical protein